MNLQYDKEKLKKLLRQNKINYLALFGSYAKDTQNPDSDLDLLFDYEDDSNLTLFDLIRIEKELSDMFQKKVDFVPIRGVKEEIKNEIIKSAVTVYEGR
jgi:uncharacterized protein